MTSHPSRSTADPTPTTTTATTASGTGRRLAPSAGQGEPASPEA